MSIISLFLLKTHNLRCILSKILHIELYVIIFVFIISNFVESFSAYSLDKKIVPLEVKEAKTKMEINKCGTDEASTPEIINKCNKWNDLIQNYKTKSFFSYFFSNISIVGNNFLNSISLQTKLKLLFSIILYIIMRKIIP